MQDLPILESLGGSAEQAQYWTAKAMPDGQWVATRRVSNLDHGAKESVQDPVESGRIPPRSVSDDSVVSQGASAAHVVSASLLVTGATPAQSDPANCLARPDAPCSPRGSGFSGLALKLPMSIARPLTLAAENRMSLLMLVPAGGGLIVSFVSRRKVWLGTAALAAAVFVYLMIDPGLTWIAAALGGTTNFASRGQSSDELGSFSGRLEMWSVQWASFLQSPWLGHGYFVSSRGGELYVWHTFSNWTAHDLWLQVLVTTGLIGMTAFLWIVTNWSGRMLAGLRRTTTLQRFGPTFGWIGLWYLGWSSINESIVGPFVPESVAFLLLCGCLLYTSDAADE